MVGGLGKGATANQATGCQKRCLKKVPSRKGKGRPQGFKMEVKRQEKRARDTPPLRRRKRNGRGP